MIFFFRSALFRFSLFFFLFLFHFRFQLLNLKLRLKLKLKLCAEFMHPPVAGFGFFANSFALFDYMRNFSRLSFVFHTSLFLLWRTTFLSAQFRRNIHFNAINCPNVNCMQMTRMDWTTFVFRTSERAMERDRERNGERRRKCNILKGQRHQQM